MARNTPNFAFKVWDLLTDRFNHTELAQNWDAVDAHDHTGGNRGLKIPRSGILPGAIDASLIDNSLKPSAGAADNIEGLRRLGTASGQALPGDTLITKTQLVAAVQQAMFSPGDIKATAAAVTAGSEPTGWLICDGRTITNGRTIYPELFLALGGVSSPYGGVTTTDFKLPDYSGRTLVGKGTPIGATGATNHTLGEKLGHEKYKLLSGESGTNGNGSTDNDGGHNHLIQMNTFNNPDTATPDFYTIRGVHNSNPDSSFTYSVDDWRSVHTHSLAARDADTPHENMQPYTVVNFLIKT